jgi:hypothetical protein
MDMIIDRQKNNIPIDTEKIKAIIEKRLVQAPSNLKATFPPVLRQDRVLFAIISQPECLIVAAEEEKQFNEFVSKQIDPLVGLITTGLERAAFRVERAKCVTARSCTVTNSFSLSLGPDSTILIEDHHQVIEAADIGLVSYTVPLAYILSYGDEIDCSTVYGYLESLVVYSTNIWTENIWLTTWPGKPKSFSEVPRLQETRN